MNKMNIDTLIKKSEDALMETINKDEPTDRQKIELVLQFVDELGLGYEYNRVDGGSEIFLEINDEDEDEE